MKLETPLSLFPILYPRNFKGAEADSQHASSTTVMGLVKACALQLGRMHSRYTDIYIYINKHFRNYLKDIWWLTCYKEWHSQEKMIPSQYTKRDKYCNKSALSCAAHRYSHSIVVQATVKENTEILQVSPKKSLCAAGLPCRCCSAGWSHRLV